MHKNMKLACPNFFEFNSKKAFARGLAAQIVLLMKKIHLQNLISICNFKQKTPWQKID
jgi:hypothetical protein